MPDYRQGDIFAISRDEGFQLAIVFGYLGLNFMACYWYDFAKAYPNVFLQPRPNPFESLPNKPVEYSHNRFMWFVPERENNGMKDSDLKEVFDEAFTWSHQTGNLKVITNGIRDTNHGHDGYINRRRDDKRVEFLSELAINAESTFNLKITLINLNDSFTRNFP